MALYLWCIIIHHIIMVDIGSAHMPCSDACCYTCCLLLIVRTSGNGDTGAEECQPVPSARKPVTYRASQAALRASM